MTTTKKTNPNKRRSLQMWFDTTLRRIQIGQHLLFISCAPDRRIPRSYARYVNQN